MLYARCSHGSAGWLFLSGQCGWGEEKLLITDSPFSSHLHHYRLFYPVQFPVFVNGKRYLVRTRTSRYIHHLQIAHLAAPPKNLIKDRSSIMGLAPN